MAAKERTARRKTTANAEILWTPRYKAHHGDWLLALWSTAVSDTGWAVYFLIGLWAVPLKSKSKHANNFGALIVDSQATRQMPYLHRAVPQDLQERHRTYSHFHVHRTGSSSKWKLKQTRSSRLFCFFHGSSTLGKRICHQDRYIT